MAHLLWLEATAAQWGVARVTVAGLDFRILKDFLKSLWKVEFFLLYIMVQYISGFCWGLWIHNKKFIPLLMGTIRQPTCCFVLCARGLRDAPRWPLHNMSKRSHEQNMKQRSSDWALGCSTVEWPTDSFRVSTIYLKMQKCNRKRWQVHHQGRKWWKHKNCTSKSRHQLQKIRVWAVLGCCAATTETGARRIPKGEEAHGRSFSISKTCINLFIKPWSKQNLSMCCKLAVDNSPLILLYPDNFARSAAHFVHFETNILCDEQTWSNSTPAGTPVQRGVSERRHRLGKCAGFLQTFKHLFKPTVKSSHIGTLSQFMFCSL